MTSINPSETGDDTARGPIPTISVAQAQLNQQLIDRFEQVVAQRDAEHKREMQIQLDAHRAQLEAHKVEIQRLIAERPTEDTTADRRRQAIVQWQNDRYVRDRLKESYLDQGFSEEQANLYSREPLPSSTDTAPTTIISQPNRRREWKPEHIGFWDGDSLTLDRFISRVQLLHDMKQDPNWREPLIETLPVCLTGSASEWLQNQPIDYKLRRLSDLNGWITELRSVFGGDSASKHLAAQARVWDYRNEDTLSYFFSKSRLMTSAHPHLSADDFVEAIILGCPDSFQLAIRGQSVSSANKLLKRLQELEGPWRRSAPNRGLRTKSSTDSAPATLVTTHSSETTQATTQSQKPQRDSLKRTFDPKNLFYDNGQECYRRPDNGQVLRRDRDCGICRQPHFDFAHDHFAKVKKEALYFETEERYAGYPVMSQTTVYAGSSPETLSSASTSTSPASSRSSPSTPLPGSTPQNSIVLDSGN